MTRILDVVERLSDRPYRTNFVLLGEPGTGKEGLGRALASLSSPAGPLVRYDVAGFPEDEALALLCGAGRRPGVAEAASGGTILLEETAGLPPRVQAALLRLLKTGRCERRGSAAVDLGDEDVDTRGDKATRRFDVRVVAMSDRDLPGEVAAGTLPPRFVSPAGARRPDVAAPARAQGGHRTGGDLDGQSHPAAGAGPPGVDGSRRSSSKRTGKTNYARWPWSLAPSRSWNDTAGPETSASWRPSWSAPCCSTARRQPPDRPPTSPPPYGAIAPSPRKELFSACLWTRSGDRDPADKPARWRSRREDRSGAYIAIREHARLEPALPAAAIAGGGTSVPICRGGSDQV